MNALQNINKVILHQKILEKLEAVKVAAFNSAQTAHKHATDKENIPDNKYDTLALEEAYLAFGQTQRVLECEKDIQVFSQLKVQYFDEDDEINLSALVTLQNKKTRNTQTYFISPCAGGVKVSVQNFEITLITKQAPLGKLMMGKCLDDEITMSAGFNNDIQYFEIISVM